MEKSVEQDLIAALKQIYDEEDTNTKQEHLLQTIDNLELYSKHILKGEPRSDAYSEIFVTYLKHFTLSIVFGEDSRNNGSGCLLRLNKDLLVTNAHVMRAAIAANSVLIGQVEVFNIEESLLSIDDELDLAVVELSIEVKEEIEDTGKMFFQPKSWPSNNPEIADHIYIVGFPGVFREDEEIFSVLHYAAIHETIMDVSDRRLLSEFNRENWKKALGQKEISELTRLGGFSGGPVFIFRDGTAELVGFTYEDGGNFFDGIKIIRSHHINKDGCIIKEPNGH